MNPTSQRPLVDLLVAEAKARKRALAEGRDPDETPEAKAVARCEKTITDLSRRLAAALPVAPRELR